MVCRCWNVGLAGILVEVPTEPLITREPERIERVGTHVPLIGGFGATESDFRESHDDWNTIYILLFPIAAPPPVLRRVLLSRKKGIEVRQPKSCESRFGSD